MSTKRFSRSDLLSFMAILVSLGAFGVSIYEANIMRDQQRIMQEQTKASIWPYLEGKSQFSYDFKEDNWQVGLEYGVLNKGVGPARIVGSELTINGKVVEKYSEITGIVEKIVNDHSDVDEQVYAEVSFGIPSGILSPDESFQLLQLNIPKIKNGTDIVNLLDVNFWICYCSIYDDCWTVKLGEDEPIEGCEMME